MSAIPQGIIQRSRHFRNHGAFGVHKDFAAPIGDHLTFVDSRAGLESINEEARSATFVISTATMDREGDIVLPSGCHTKNFSRNPVVFFDHQNDPLPIGTSRGPDGTLGIRVTNDAVHGTVWFHDVTQMARDVWELVRKRIMVATSVGFAPLKSERIMKSGFSGGDNDSEPAQPRYRFTQWDLLEWSICGVPVNPDALMVELSSGRVKSRELRRCFKSYCTPKRRSWSNGWLLEKDWSRETGPRGGTRWRNSETGNISYGKKPPGSGKKKPKKESSKKPKAEKVTPEAAKSKIKDLLAKESISTEDAKSLATTLQGLTVGQLNGLKKELGLKASGKKAELANKIAERALAKQSGAATEKPKPNKPSSKPTTKKPSPKPRQAKPKKISIRNASDFKSAVSDLKKNGTSSDLNAFSQSLGKKSLQKSFTGDIRDAMIIAMFDAASDGDIESVDAIAGMSEDEINELVENQRAGMDVKSIHSIRFNKSKFPNADACIKWLRSHGVSAVKSKSNNRFTFSFKLGDGASSGKRKSIADGVTGVLLKGKQYKECDDDYDEKNYDEEDEDEINSEMDDDEFEEKEFDDEDEEFEDKSEDDDEEFDAEEKANDMDEETTVKQGAVVLANCWGHHLGVKRFAEDMLNTVENPKVVEWLTNEVSKADECVEQISAIAQEEYPDVDFDSLMTGDAETGDDADVMEKDEDELIAEYDEDEDMDKAFGDEMNENVESEGGFLVDEEEEKRLRRGKSKPLTKGYVRRADKDELADVLDEYEDIADDMEDDDYGENKALCRKSRMRVRSLRSNNKRLKSVIFRSASRRKGEDTDDEQDQEVMKTLRRTKQDLVYLRNGMMAVIDNSQSQN